MKIRINTHGNELPVSHGEWVDLYTAEDVEMGPLDFKIISLGVGRIEGGQMRWRDIQLNLQKFEREAKKLLDETGADHVVYGMKLYEDGHLKEVRFYLQPMDEEEFDRVARLKGVMVYALHKRI